MRVAALEAGDLSLAGRWSMRSKQQRFEQGKTGERPQEYLRGGLPVVSCEVVQRPGGGDETENTGNAGRQGPGAATACWRGARWMQASEAGELGAASSGDAGRSGGKAGMPCWPWRGPRDASKREDHAAARGSG